MNAKMKEMIKNVLYYLFILLVVWLLLEFVVQRTDVEGSSMEPSLTNGDVLFVDKISYRFSDPERFDIIVFPYEQNPEKKFIKRIVGLPGETVCIDTEGKIYIDGELLEENYGLETIASHTIGVAAQPIVLGEDEYFVLGDNRNDSKDSRMSVVGNIEREDIIGRAWLRIWPIQEFGFMKNK